MKLSTFITPSGVEHIGALMEDGLHLVDFTASSTDPAFVSMLALIDAGPAGLEHARSLLKAAKVVHALSAVQLRAPVPFVWHPGLPHGSRQNRNRQSLVRAAHLLQVQPLQCHWDGSRHFVATLLKDDGL